MEAFLIAGIGIGAFMFFLLIFKKEKQLGDFLFLSWILITLGQIAFYYYTIYIGEIQGILAIISFGLPLLGAPVLFLYIFWLTGYRINWIISTCHLSIYIVYVLLIFLLASKSGTILTLKDGYFEFGDATPYWSNYYAIPLAISGLIYCIWGIWLLKKHRKSIDGLFSFKEKINLKWITYIVYAYFLLFVIASFLIFGSSQFHLLTVPKAFALVGISLCLMLVSFGFFALRQTAIFSNVDISKFSYDGIKNHAVDKSNYSKSGLSLDKIQSLAIQLQDYMIHEKPYLNENLTLPMLAEKLKISPSNLSQVINQHFENNFYDFINAYRIELAKEMIVSGDYSHLTILGIAFDCGFKSKSSFNRYFKKYTGISPSQFKNSKN